MTPGWLNDRSDLCSYMRALFFALFLLSLAAFMLITWPYGWYLVFHPLMRSPLQQVILAFWGITTALSGFAALIDCIVLIIKTKEHHAQLHADNEHKSGIISAYLKSLKEKTCVIITYADES